MIWLWISIAFVVGDVTGGYLTLRILAANFKEVQTRIDEAMRKR